MKHILLDANVIIRFITNDDDIQSPIAYKLFEKATQQEFTLVLSPIIIAECTWVLQMKRYGYLNMEITKIFERLILSPGIKTLDEKSTLDALTNYSEHNVDFIDAYLSSISKSDKYNYPIVTWNDKHFKRLSCEFFTPENLF